MTLNKPSLLIYTFAAKEQWKEDTESFFRAHWAACTRPVKSGGLDLIENNRAMCDSMAFPSSVNEHPYGFHVRAAARTPENSEEAEAFYVALMFELHDIIGMVVFLAPNREMEGIEAWGPQWRMWRNAIGAIPRPASILSEYVVFYALSEDAIAPEAGEAVVKALSKEAMASEAGEVAEFAKRGDNEPWRKTPICQTENGVFLWEMKPIGGYEVMAALAPESQDEAFTQWAFWRTPTELAVFARCLIQAAKINYEWRLFEKQMPTVRAQQKAMDASISEILKLHQEIEAGKQDKLESLVAEQTRLGREQTNATGLLFSLSYLRELQQTVAIAEQNLKSLMPKSAEGAGAHCTLFRQELARAQWLEKQIGHDIGYLQAVRERAQEVCGITALRLEQATRKAVEKQEATARKIEKRHGRMEVVQTVILGALLVSLDAMQTFQTKISLPDDLKWILIALVMSAIFLIPLLILHWHEPYSAIDYVGGVLVGGTAAWFGTAYWWHSNFNEFAPLGWIALFSILGAVVFCGLIKALDRLQQRWRDKHSSDETMP